MRILIAPDKFKGSLGAPDVARAMAEGARRALPDASIEMRPLADGGEGTIDALLAALGGDVATVEVSGPLGEAVLARWARLADGRAALEAAAASGLVLLDEAHRDALRASSRGTGELIAAAIDADGVRELIVGIGGTASTDGGTGAASALGWRFLDGRGRAVGPGGAALRDLRRIDGDGVAERLRDVRVLGACDVGSPLLGEDGAARTFAPQKGATGPEVEVLEEGLATLAEAARRDLGAEVAGAWAAGAGGGLGAGLLLFFGATLRGGFELLAKASDLEGAIADSEIVVTGEGRLDDQSAAGKVPAGVAHLARAHGVRCVAIAGEVDVDVAHALGFDDTASLVAEVGRARAFEEPEAALAEVTERLLGNGPRHSDL
ncbi:MAG: glycerate kinase [Actinomycetota bacterium]